MNNKSFKDWKENLLKNELTIGEAKIENDNLEENSAFSRSHFSYKSEDSRADLAKNITSPFNIQDQSE